MFDTALFDVGTHLIYGGVDYTVTAEPDSDGNVLYADYYFSVEVVDEPEFEPWDADLNGDGIVDMRDFALFASAWLYGAEE